VKCNLNQYVRNYTESFQPYSHKKEIQLTFIGTETPIEGWIDPHKMDSILHNLLSNAMKYTPEGGQVNVRLQLNRSEWQLDITDTGIGISVADQKKMFKHLFRGQNAVNQRITGSGIGMLQTYRLVKRHQGKITVTSAVNEGTTFRLCFPLDHKKYIHHTDSLPMEWTVSAPITTEDIPSSGCLQTAPFILIVEDNPDLRHFLHQSLAESYRIVEATNGQEALEEITREQPDLIISDIMMPIMRGDDLCQTLKSQMETSHIPVILLTALGDRESILHGLNVKADSYVTKPFDIDILKANIASVLANKEFIRQRFAQLNYRTEDLPQEVPGLELDQKFLEKATSRIKKNLDKEFTVDDLCLEMGMSRSSLYNKVKALTGHSPSDFVRQVRMKAAADLLRSKKHTVSEVSDMLGYSDPKYFTEIFKKHYGITPSAYMKQEQP
jgi:DNA-binding response OmpR family regulator